MNYRVPVLENFVWQPSVKDRLDTAPGSPVKGDRYLVIGTPSAPWEGKTGYIAYCSESGTPGVWAFDAPLEGMIVWVDDENKYYHCTGGTTWAEYLGQQGEPGEPGSPGEPGESAFVYIAYASDDAGTDFTMTFDPDLDYIAILTTNTEIPSPQASDFAGLWKNYKGEQGEQGEPGPTATYDGDYGCLIIEV